MSENLIQANSGTPWADWQQAAHLARATWITLSNCARRAAAWCCWHRTPMTRFSWPVGCWRASTAGKTTWC